MGAWARFCPHLMPVAIICWFETGIGNYESSFGHVAGGIAWRGVGVRDCCFLRCLLEYLVMFLAFYVLRLPDVQELLVVGIL